MFLWVFSNTSCFFGVKHCYCLVNSFNLKVLILMLSSVLLYIYIPQVFAS